MKSSSAPSTKSAGSTKAPTSAASNYAPSVPITVYRELAAELQAIKSLLDTTNQRNQQLTQENQLLRQEMERVVGQALQLQQVLQLGMPATPPHPAQADAEQVAQQIRAGQFFSPPAPVEPQPPTPPVLDDPTLLSNQLFTEEPSAPRRVESAKAPRDLGNFWLTVLVILIIITAFGAGFILVRPYLKNR